MDQLNLYLHSQTLAQQHQLIKDLGLKSKMRGYSKMTRQELTNALSSKLKLQNDGGTVRIISADTKQVDFVAPTIKSRRKDKPVEVAVVSESVKPKKKPVAKPDLALDDDQVACSSQQFAKPPTKKSTPKNKESVQSQSDDISLADIQNKVKTKVALIETVSKQSNLPKLKTTKQPKSQPVPANEELPTHESVSIVV